MAAHVQLKSHAGGKARIDQAVSDAKLQSAARPCSDSPRSAYSGKLDIGRREIGDGGCTTVSECR